MFFGDNYIGIYDGALTRKECEMIINRFETKDEYRQLDSTKSCSYEDQVKFLKDPSHKCKEVPLENSKICKEISFDLRDVNDSFYHRMVKTAITRKFHLYQKRYPFIAGGSNSCQFHLTSIYNLQKYNDGEGYFNLHNEHGTLSPYRMLTWMIYLNDAKCGTWFPTQKKTIKPKTGRLVIWPASWTHPHKGVTPNVGKKYILTGWWNYEPKYEDGDIISYDLHSDGSLFAKY